LIEIDRLTFRYRGSETDALSELSLSVPDGSLFGLLGPNGSGKTTLVSLLTGILPAPRDRVRIAGVELAARTREIQRFSALVPQEYAFYPRLSAAQNLRFFAGVQSIPPAQIDARIDEVLAITGLGDARAKAAGTFSGGMKRRLNFAIGMLNRPKLLYLDEPTVGVDPQSRHFLLEAVRRVHREGTTVVYTSHYMEEIESLCDVIAVIDHGRCLVQGTLAELLASARGQKLVVNLAHALDETQRAALRGVDGLEVRDAELSIERCGENELRRVMAFLSAQSVAPTRVKYGHGNLEELFLHLTQRTLRD
jgi:ABC-2 type transport system ATP-binding protein